MLLFVCLFVCLFVVGDFFLSLGGCFVVAVVCLLFSGGEGGREGGVCCCFVSYQGLWSDFQTFLESRVVRDPAFPGKACGQRPSPS